MATSYPERWIQVAHAEPGGDAGIRTTIKAHEYESWHDQTLKEHPDWALFKTAQEYTNKASCENGGPDSPHGLDPYFDIDRLDNDGNGDLPKALEDAETLATRLDEKKIPYCIYFSGKKGFGIEIPREAFGITPDIRNTKAIEQLAKFWMDETGIQLDLAIYSKRRLIRSPGTRHQKSGLYKIPLTSEELFTLTVDQIVELARTPRNIPDEMDYTQNPNLVEGWRAALENVSLYENEKGTPCNLSELEKGKPQRGELPEWALKVISSGAITKGSRNNTRFRLALAAMKVGWGKKDIFEMFEKYNENLKSKDALEKMGAQLEQIFRQVSRGEVRVDTAIRLGKLVDAYKHMDERVEFTANVSSGEMRMVLTSDVKGVPKGVPTMVLQLEDGSAGGDCSLRCFWETEAKDTPYGTVIVCGTVKAPEQKEDKQGNPKTTIERVHINAESVVPIGGVWENYRLEETDINDAKKWNSLNYNELKAHADLLVAPNIKGRSFAKLTSLCVVASTLHTPLARKKFALKQLNAGKEREGKDATEEGAVEYAPEAISGNAETASTAGLVGGIVNDKEIGGNVIRWGLFPQGHEKVLHLRGISGLPPERISELRENLSSDRVSISKIKSGSRPAMVRMLLSGNTNRDMASYPTFYDAIRDVGSGGDAILAQAPDFKRLHMVIPFPSDVALTEKFDAQFDCNVVDAKDKELVKKLVRASWASKPEDWVWDKVALKKEAGELAMRAKRHNHVELAVLDSEGIYILSALAASISVLRGKIVDAHFVVGREEFSMAMQMIDEMLVMLQVEPKQKNEETKHLAAKWVSKLIETSSRDEKAPHAQIGTLMDVMRELWVAHRPMTWEELANIMKISERTVRAHCYIAQTWIAEQAFPEFGSTWDLVGGKPKQGNTLSEFGVLVGKNILKLVYEKKQSGKKVHDESCHFARFAKPLCSSLYIDEKEKEKDIYTWGTDAPGLLQSGSTATSDVKETARYIEKEGEPAHELIQSGNPAPSDVKSSARLSGKVKLSYKLANGAEMSCSCQPEDAETRKREILSMNPQAVFLRQEAV